MKNYIVIFFLISSNVIFSQENKLQKSIEWNGYAQLRTYSNFNDNAGFMLRRLKLWVKSKPDFSEHWSYKFQTTITSLQHFQHDYEIPLTERTAIAYAYLPSKRHEKAKWIDAGNEQFTALLKPGKIYKKSSKK